MKTAKSACSTQKPTAFLLLWFFERQGRNRRTSRVTGSHGFFSATFTFLPDFNMNNQHDLVKIPEVYYGW